MEVFYLSLTERGWSGMIIYMSEYAFSVLFPEKSSFFSLSLVKSHDKNTFEAKFVSLSSIVHQIEKKSVKNSTVQWRGAG